MALVPKLLAAAVMMSAKRRQHHGAAVMAAERSLLATRQSPVSWDVTQQLDASGTIGIKKMTTGNKVMFSGSI
jgi:hypothetical protein